MSIAQAGHRCLPDADCIRYSYNSLGHITINSYDAHGRPKAITDPNGLTTQLTYTPRGWLATRTVGGLLMQFTYDNVGQLTQVTMPDNSFIGYAYDTAHRLYQITSTAGDKLVYTLDLMGNRTKQDVFDTLMVGVAKLADTASNISAVARHDPHPACLVARHAWPKGKLEGLA